MGRREHMDRRDGVKTGLKMGEFVAKTNEVTPAAIALDVAGVIVRALEHNARMIEYDRPVTGEIELKWPGIEDPVYVNVQIGTQRTLEAEGG